MFWVRKDSRARLRVSLALYETPGSDTYRFVVQLDVGKDKEGLNGFDELDGDDQRDRHDVLKQNQAGPAATDFNWHFEDDSVEKRTRK